MLTSLLVGMIRTPSAGEGAVISSMVVQDQIPSKVVPEMILSMGVMATIRFMATGVMTKFRVVLVLITYMATADRMIFVVTVGMMDCLVDAMMTCSMAVAVLIGS